MDDFLSASPVVQDKAGLSNFNLMGFLNHAGLHTLKFIFFENKRRPPSISQNQNAFNRKSYKTSLIKMQIITLG